MYTNLKPSQQIADRGKVRLYTLRKSHSVDPVFKHRHVQADLYCSRPATNLNTLLQRLTGYAPTEVLFAPKNTVKEFTCITHQSWARIADMDLQDVQYITCDHICNVMLGFTCESIKSVCTAVRKVVRSWGVGCGESGKSDDNGVEDEEVRA